MQKDTKLGRTQSGERTMTTATYNDVFHDYVREKYAPLKHAAKILARKADVSPRTAEAWLAKKAAPNADTIFTLMAECDELYGEIAKLIEARRNAGSV